MGRPPLPPLDPLPPYPGHLLQDWMWEQKLSKRRAAALLGCSYNSLAVWTKPGAFAPAYIGLACSALTMRLGQWGVVLDPNTAPAAAAARRPETEAGSTPDQKRHSWPPLF